MVDQVLLVTIFGLETDVNAFISAVETSGLDMKIYGEFSVCKHTNKSPSSIHFSERLTGNSRHGVFIWGL